MKKIFALILAMVLCIGLLAACGNGDTKDTTPAASNSGNTDTKDTTPPLPVPAIPTPRA